MPIPLLALPLLAQLVMVADGVPHWDITKSCRGAPAVGTAGQIKDLYKHCIEFEHGARETLAKNWSGYSKTDREVCIGSIQWFEPTYSELLTCIEMKRDLKKGADNAPRARSRL